LNQTDGNSTEVPVNSHGTPSSPLSASVAEGFAQHNDVTSQTVNNGLIDLPRPKQAQYSRGGDADTPASRQCHSDRHSDQEEKQRILLFSASLYVLLATLVCYLHAV